MRDYANVSPQPARERRVWKGIWRLMQKMNLSTSERVLLMWGITSPRTDVVPTIARASVDDVAQQIGFTCSEVERFARDLADKHLMSADWEAEIVFTPPAFHGNEPCGPNGMKSWRRYFDALPHCRPIGDAFSQAQAFAAKKSSVWLQALYDGPTGRRYWPRRDRSALLEASGGVCSYCGKALSLASLQVDHVVPISRGGADDLSNTIAACRSCNASKGARTPDEWRANG